jgi:hypothetical protein
MARDAIRKEPRDSQLEERACVAAEARAELAERDALWAKYPSEMSALEAAEDAFYHAPMRGLGRKQAENRLERAKKALENVRKGEDQ